jgi:hypothetical protein
MGGGCKMNPTQRKKSPLGKWLALFISFVGAMCSICLGFALVTGAANELPTLAAFQPSATTNAVQFPTTEFVPTLAPASTLNSAPTVVAVSTPFPVTVVAISSAAIGEPEALVLKQVGALIPMCPPDFGSNTLFVSTNEAPARFQLACGVGWGHIAEVEIRRYESPVEAKSAFTDLCGVLPAQDFHDRPALGWKCLTESYVNCGPSGGIKRGMLHRNHCWQADRWLICAHAFDDSGWRLAPDPLKISEAVYQASVEQGLLPMNP